jgi:hypothetical protein
MSIAPVGRERILSVGCQYPRRSLLTRYLQMVLLGASTKKAPEHGTSPRVRVREHIRHDSSQTSQTTLSIPPCKNLEMRHPLYVDIAKNLFW